MIGVKVEIEGDKEVIQQLNTVEHGVMPEVARDMEFAGMPIKLTLQSYPPEIPGSPYVRTFNYMNSIEVHVGMQGDTVTYEATQGADYSIFLRGDESGRGQAPVHIGRWRTTLDIIETIGQVVISRLQAVVENFIKRVTGS